MQASDRLCCLLNCCLLLAQLLLLHISRRALRQCHFRLVHPSQSACDTPQLAGSTPRSRAPPAAPALLQHSCACSSSVRSSSTSAPLARGGSSGSRRRRRRSSSWQRRRRRRTQQRQHAAGSAAAAAAGADSASALAQAACMLDAASSSMHTRCQRGLPLRSRTPLPLAGTLATAAAQLKKPLLLLLLPERRDLHADIRLHRAPAHRRL